MGEGVGHPLSDLKHFSNFFTSSICQEMVGAILAKSCSARRQECRVTGKTETLKAEITAHH